MALRLGDHLDFRSGRAAPKPRIRGPFRVYGANGAIGSAAARNAAGPVIVIGRVGTYCGSVHYSDSDIWVTDNAFTCRPKNAAETRFWYYALRAVGLNGHRCGSGQPLLNQSILCDIPAPDVSAEHRPRIGALLGAVDHKIAAGRRVIAAAEALMVGMAEMVSHRVPLSSLAARSGEFADPQHFPEFVAHFSLPAFDEGATPLVVAGASIRSGKFLLRQPCVLFAKLNPRIPRVWNVADMPPQLPVASSEFVVLTPAGVGASVLWAALCQADVSEALQRQVVGTSGSHQRIRPRDLLDVGVRDVRRLPPDAAQTITDLGALCQTRRIEIARLAAYRDALLPLLMSGEVRIGDAVLVGQIG
ncbi:restriction endonuclease subunit S [Mycobacterium sp. TY814]|uniref:restriction endonuclease subunit S n=1 Tax=unclassified Mycobacterium TaxID=2642494 RepID=UPI002740B757|nr:restriction endonuclease subunit S [Mycobacterium sp. TY814]MDP7721258.1 restriction endonuclease subunit S [Mycobacterium sp. TY814]